MGTRSLTRVISTYNDEEKNKRVKFHLVNMYRQFDGYPEGHGVELAEFLNAKKVVNGIGSDRNVFNGASCLAAQMVAHFKTGAGGFYLEPISAKECGQEYEYEILVDYDTQAITLRCLECGYVNKKGEYKNGKRLLFEGQPSDFETFLQKLNAGEE